jgi:hypothetical protein
MRRPFPVSLAVRPALSALGDALTRQILRVGYQPLGYRSAVKFLEPGRKRRGRPTSFWLWTLAGVFTLLLVLGLVIRWLA